MSICVQILLFVFVITNAVFIPFRQLHDYAKDGRPVDGPFPSNLMNIPYYCYQAPSKGPCDRVFFVWFYDVVRRECMPMFYSGCGGNENRFTTKADCQNHCDRKRRI
ncbi:mambaquaretin-9-like [Achroia grisella]|uniref:mambaquaretin-9-like n=1 Tax=Achroia grisella TaxID=688607 RepID=UPI0027D2562D|nr:mambaquaretin-9-like [Achroia grisella]